MPSRYIFDHELILIDKGYGTIYTELGAYPYREGSLILIPPGVLHSFRDGASGQDSPGYGHYAIHFDWHRSGNEHLMGVLGDEDGPISPEDAQADNLAEESLWLPDLVLCDQAPPEVGAAVRAVVAAYGAKQDTLRRLRTHAALYSLILALADALRGGLLDAAILTNRTHRKHHLYTERTEITRYILNMHHAVQQTPIEKEILEQWPDTVHFSQAHFHRLFKEQTGLPLHSYFTRLRMEKAALMLLGTELSVQEIAYSCGYDDAKYFSRAFRKAEGMSPLSFRVQMNAGYAGYAGHMGHTGHEGYARHNGHEGNAGHMGNARHTGHAGGSAPGRSAGPAPAQPTKSADGQPND